MLNNNHLSSLPNMQDVIKSWSTDYIAYLITYTIENHIKVEQKRKIHFRGIIQVSDGENENITSQGNRVQNHFKLHTTYRFNINDIIEILGIRYKVINRRQDITYYGFYSYELIEQYE